MQLVMLRNAIDNLIYCMRKNVDENVIATWCYIQSTFVAALEYFPLKLLLSTGEFEIPAVANCTIFF